MIKRAIAVVFLLAAFQLAHAQSRHSVTVSFTPGVPTGTQASATSFNLYRANCSATLVSGACPTASEGTFAKVSSCTASPCADTLVVASATYSYYLTGVNPSAAPTESVPSAHIGAAIPSDSPPPPPLNLSIQVQ